MNQQTTDILNQVTQKTNSDLIYFFVILAVIILAVSIPLYTLTIKENREKRKQEMERADAQAKREKEMAEIQAKREAGYIGVIQGNTAVQERLVTMLEISNTNCIECKYEHQEKMETFGEKLDMFGNKLTEKIDSHNDKLVEVAVLLKQIIPISPEAAATKE